MPLLPLTVPLLPHAAGPVGSSGTLQCQCFVDLAYSDSVLFVFIFIGFSLATMVRNDVHPVRRLQTCYVHQQHLERKICNFSVILYLRTADIV